MHRVIAACCQAVVDTKLEAGADDVGFGKRYQRGQDFKPFALYPGLGRQVGKLTKGLEKLRPAVGVAAVVDRIDSQNQAAGTTTFCQSQRKRQEDSIASRHVCAGNTTGHCRIAAAFGDNLGVIHQRTPAKGCQIDWHDGVVNNAEAGGYLPGSVDFNPVPLTVVNGEGCQPLASGKGPGGGSRRIEAPGEQDNGGGFSEAVVHGTISSMSTLPNSIAAEPSRDLLETFPNQFPGRDYLIEIVCPEFTSVCPKTGQPDFGTLTFRYIAGDRCVELKSLKLYLQAFRQAGIFYENVSNRIVDDLVAVLDPRRLTLVARFTPRGGISSCITVSYPTGDHLAAAG